MWYSICDCLDIFHLNIREAASFTSACPSTFCWISSSQFSTVLSTVVKTSVMGRFNTEWPALIIQKLAFINSSSMRLSLVCEWWREETSRLPLHSGSAGAPFSILCSFSSNKQTNPPASGYKKLPFLLCGDRSARLMSLVYVAKARSINSQGIQSSHTAFPGED